MNTKIKIKEIPELKVAGIKHVAINGIESAFDKLIKWAEGVSKTILFNLCGHGNFDMKAYEDYFAGKIVKHELTKEEIHASLAQLDTPEIS